MPGNALAADSPGSRDHSYDEMDWFAGAAFSPDGVKLANDTPYGLASAVWTKDIHRAHRVASQIRAGTVWINAYRVVAPSVPFGGYNASGLGRENGIAVIDEYLETKSVWVELSGGTRDPFTLG
jgi:Aldehyde dehydrogenase family